MAESTPVVPFPHPTAAEYIGSDDDVHGFKSQGRGDLSKTHSFPDTETGFQEYPKHIAKDGKTYSIAAEGSEPKVLPVWTDILAEGRHSIEGSPLAGKDPEAQARANYEKDQYIAHLEADIARLQVIAPNVEQPINGRYESGAPAIVGAGDGTHTADGTFVPEE